MQALYLLFTSLASFVSFCRSLHEYFRHFRSSIGSVPIQEGGESSCKVTIHFLASLWFLYILTFWGRSHSLDDILGHGGTKMTARTIVVRHFKYSPRKSGLVTHPSLKTNENKVILHLLVEFWRKARPKSLGAAFDGANADGEMSIFCRRDAHFPSDNN